MRYSKSSYSSCTSSDGHAPSVPSRDEVSTPSHSAPGSPSTPVGGNDLVLSPWSTTPESSAPEVARSSLVDNVSGADVNRKPGFSPLRSLSVDQPQPKSLLKHRGPSRAGTTPSRHRLLHTMPLPIESLPTGGVRVVRNGPPRWRFLPFFRGDSSQTTVPADLSLAPGESTEMTASPTTCIPRKGDVVCLGYDSLDDKAMRRLEGRSDHRPVIGSFAVYL